MMASPNSNKPDETPTSSDESTKQPSSSPSTPRRQGVPDDLLNTVGASPPAFVSFDQLMAAADGMKNMSLAHEIAVNNDFELEQGEPPNSFEKQVRETVQRAFWDAFEEKIHRDPPDLSMAYGMLEELKQNLLGILLPQHQRVKDQIKEVLDLDLIKHQMDNGAFDFEFYGKYVVDTMAKLCSPARDEKIEEIKRITDITPKFRLIMETIELMRKDMANFTIRQIRPYIQQNSIEYERKKFAQFFDAQKALSINALQYTEVWLQRNYEKLLAGGSPGGEATVLAGPGAAGKPPVPTPANILTQAYVEILEWSDPHNFPETLQIDEQRLMALRDKLHMLGLITSVQLITFSVVGPSAEGVSDLKQQLKEHTQVLLGDVAHRGINDVLASLSEQVIKDVDDSLRSRQFTLLSEDKKTALRGQIASLGTREDRVRKIMLSRLMEFICEGMSGAPVQSLRVPKGCTAVQEELTGVLGNMMRLSSHNRSVFGPWYAQIIERLLKGSEDTAAPQTSDASSGATSA